MKIIAHRGASHDAPENTLAAIALAWKQHADAVEIDVHLSKDGNLVVIHDATTKRTCGVSDKVRKRTLAELKILDAGKWKGVQWAGERIPALDEVLANVPKDKGLVIELKGGPELLPELKRVLTRSALKPGRIFLASFSLPTMTLVKRTMPDYGACWITGFRRRKPSRSWSPTPTRLIERAKKAGMDGLDLYAECPIDADFVRQVKAAGMKLYVWTVDSVAPARKLKAAGVDGITTNRPGWLREKLGPI